MTFKISAIVEHVESGQAEEYTFRIVKVTHLLGDVEVDKEVNLVQAIGEVVGFLEERLSEQALQVLEERLAAL